MFARAPVAVLACGNPSRGDDALGPLLLERLRAWLATDGRSAGYELIGDCQWQIEHALDLVGRELVLFIDAGALTPAPFVFAPVQASGFVGPGSHALSPQALLSVLARIGDEPPPAAFVLAVRGERFELGGALGQNALAHADAAFAFLQELCRAASAAAWRNLLGRSLQGQGQQSPEYGSALALDLDLDLEREEMVGPRQAFIDRQNRLALALPVVGEAESGVDHRR
ncbi:hydrogenase maturation protease [Accumulibacter sp.]|uniref:hydrogenase maturation protease n=1 Tax=Accumulibacter sp. TaxID=2053492 RepID=UPI0025F891BE|nr:hydrogenase maturation protease [Accumulibacter sp.]MCM8612063.1 hydrogenase maturation protease [Accumulibacter sp.]MCM8635729.1 hydrogenase maturation protease [Accumulibacter sp.]MCM8639636.1 hydrogenase maturation protease [Accumulibacter sp.]